MTAWKGVVGVKFSPEGFATYCDSLTLTNEFRPAFVVLHNTQDPRLDEWHSCSGDARMRGLARYYRNDLGWSGGPHLFIADDGIWVFTPLIVPGVHSPSWNAESWGVELVGDYDHEPFGDAVKGNAFAALATLHRLAGWREPTIRLHKDDPKTTHTYCPGAHVDRAEVEQGVRTLLETTR